MSINSSDLPNITEDIHAGYGFSGSSFDNPNPLDYVNNRFSQGNNNNRVMSLHQDYYIPLASIKQQVYGTFDAMNRVKDGIETNFLSNLYIDPAIDFELYDAHKRVWDEAAPYINIPSVKTDEYPISKSDTPDYICFDEYRFAERSGSTASRRLISEFDEAISQSTFSYFYQLRKLLGYFISEINNIKLSLLADYGTDYENESQQKIAIRYDTWAKVALHYTGRIASTILSKPGEIPYAEVDKVSEKQAAQFQAFFAIRLNAVDEEINDLLAAIKRDLVDNSDIFYTRYLRNTIRMTKDVADPLKLEYITTNLRREIPMLAGEALVASNILLANFSSIHADLVERFELMLNRVDAVLMLVHEKRKYANYISQLAEKASQKRKVLKTVTEDKYSLLFRSVSIFQMKPEKYKSSHGNLDDLEADWHPQYLLKNGGTLSGDIVVDSGVKIDGISISKHAHSGADGSERISSKDIDYGSIRNGDYENNVSKPLSVRVDSFIPDIIDGGVPVFDTVIAIEIGDEILNNHEYEIIYTEVE